MPETATVGATPAEAPAATTTEPTAPATGAATPPVDSTGAPVAPPATTEPPKEGERKEPDPTGAKNPDAYTAAIQREREAREKAEKALKDATDKARKEKMSAEERAAEELKELQTRATSAEGQLERLRVAVDAKLLPEGASLDQYLEVSARLQGETPEALKQDVERLRPLFSIAAPAAPASATEATDPAAPAAPATGNWDAGVQPQAGPSFEGTGLFPHLYEKKA